MEKTEAVSRSRGGADVPRSSVFSACGRRSRRLPVRRVGKESLWGRAPEKRCLRRCDSAAHPRSDADQEGLFLVVVAEESQ